MNTAAQYTSSWMKLALDLEEENRELRRIAEVFFAWILEREELAEFALAAVEKKFPEQAKKVA